MLNLVYLISFGVIILGLLLWTNFNSEKADKIFRGMTLTALLAYGLSWLFQVAPVEYKLEIAFRDLLVVAASGAVFTYVARKRKLFLLLLSITIAIGYWYYKTELTQSFPFEVTSTSEIDETGELLIELKAGLSDNEMQEFQSWANQNRVTLQTAFDDIIRIEDTDLDDYWVLDLPEKANLINTIKKLEALSFVESVERNEVIMVNPIIPTKLPKKINQRFGINDPGLEQLWSFEKMKMDKLYQLLDQQSSAPQKQALVAILDTGVDSQHEDLKGNYKSVVKSSDNDPKGHGTHCAGIAGAVSNNGVGVASFSRTNEYVDITSIKVLNSMGYGTQKSIINGIVKAADSGADVISLSLGGPSDDRKQRAYSQAVEYANQAGAIVVVAAGNSNMNAKKYSPVNSKGVIGVSAIDQDLKRASFSNFVQDISMGIAAPGVGIYSTIPGNQYATYNGTSMATPYVAGLVGLMKYMKPDLDTKEAFRILKETGIKTGNTKETGMFIQPTEAIKALNK